MSEKPMSLEFRNRKYEFSIPAENLAGVLKPREFPAIEDTYSAIKKVLRNPIGSPPLKQIVKKGEKVGIIISNSGRPWVHNDKLLPPLLDELNETGIPDDNIFLMMANGTMAEEGPEEQKSIVGEGVYDRVKILNHRCDDRDSGVYLGTTSRNTLVFINNQIVAADRVILTGGITFHENAGYGGGRKAILPGVSLRATINGNHMHMLDPVPGNGLSIKAVSGVLKDNPVHEDMVEIASMVSPDFMLNSVVNVNEEDTAFFAGHFVSAWEEGCKLAREAQGVPLAQKADLAITTSGNYEIQTRIPANFKKLLSACTAVHEGGVVIMLSSSIDGSELPEAFKRPFNYDTLYEMDYDLRKDYSVPGYVGFLYAHLTYTRHVILVNEDLSQLPDDPVKLMRFERARSIEEALDMAEKYVGKSPRTVVIPKPSTTFPLVNDLEIYTATRRWRQRDESR